jgi:integrase
MKTQQNQKHFPMMLADARQIQSAFLIASEGPLAKTSRINRATTDMFLQYLRGMESDSADRVILNTDNLIRWMIQDCRGRAVSHATQRLGILGRYLHALHLASLTATDLMADFRAAHGQCGWKILVAALQSADPAAALTALESQPRPPVGPLHQYVQRYVELHESLGKMYRSQRLALLDLDRYLCAWNVCSPQAVDAAMIQRWVVAMTCTPHVRMHKTRFVRRFFDYLKSLQIVAQNPLGPARFVEVRPKPTTFQPFIFSREQIVSILAHVKQLPPSQSFPLRGSTGYMMLALLYTLGLRHGEVLRLRIRDVDLNRQTLLIVETKFHKNRLIPFGPKLGLRLQTYLDQRRSLFRTCHEEEPLFVACWRKVMCHETLLNTFRAGLRSIELPGKDGMSLPRLHDLRHTFAVHRLLRWYQEGVDVQNRLTVLATFMGHVNITSTQLYLTITFDLLQEASGRFHRHFGCQFDAEVRP